MAVGRAVVGLLRRAAYPDCISMWEFAMAENRRITVTPGEEVFTRDGEQLGVVKELRGDAHFKIDAPRARDYWLACDVLLETNGRRITVDFDSSDLDAYQLDEPAPVTAADPLIDAETNDGLSEAERERRQQQMKSGYPSAVAPPGDLRKDPH
jgi:hypothetical protein